MPGYSVSAGGGGPSGADSTGGFTSAFNVNNGSQGTCPYCMPLMIGAAAIAAVVWFKMR